MNTTQQVNCYQINSFTNKPKEIPNIITLNNNNLLKMQFIKEKYNFISWENIARETQLVSNLYSQQEANEKVTKIFSCFLYSKNEQAIKIFSSRDKDVPNQYHITINLNKFEESTLYHLKQ